VNSWGFLMKSKFFFLMECIFVVMFSITLTCGADDESEVTFFNVGQGNCTIFSSRKNGVVVIDAGSTSVPDGIGLSPLSSKIVSRIKPLLKAKTPLTFIMSHADQDHLNLVEFITRALCPKPVDRKNHSLKYIFGGEESEYKTSKSKELLDYANKEKICKVFGKDFTENPDGLSFSTPDGFGFPMDPSEIKFFSVKRETDDSDNNAPSIVMKIDLGGITVMLTGDKTKKETKYIIDRFRTLNKLDELRSDILLATHHGSFGDFVLEWAQLIRPKHIIFSAGRSSNWHPHSNAFLGYYSHSKESLSEVEWHLVKFHGVFEDIEDERLRVIFREVTSSEEKARGYDYAVTNYGLFVTSSQGTVSFYVDPSNAHLTYNANPTWKTARETIHSFINDPVLPDLSSPIEFESIHLDDEREIDIDSLLPRLKTTASLKSLSLKGCEVRDIHVDELCELITAVSNLTSLNLKGIVLSSDSFAQIKEAWNHRGLSLQDN